MNLKEAARTLGVHYQTAYKWVRSGELAAVRIGSRYEVSPAAIDQFRAKRRTVVEQAIVLPDEQRRIGDMAPEDFLEELEAMTADPIVTIPAVEGFVARRAANLIGDACLVTIDDAAGQVRHALVDHPRADRAAFYNVVIGLSGPALMQDQGFLRGAMRRGETVLMPIVDQEALRRSLRAELRQYLAVYPVHSLVGAPVSVDGEVRGILCLIRDHAGRPYTADDETLVARIAERLGGLLRTADDIAAAWRLRRELADRALEAQRRRRPGRPLTPDEADDLLRGPTSPARTTHLPCIVWSSDDTVLAVNDAFERVLGFARSEFVGRPRPATVPQPGQLDDQARWEALRRGDVDYDDMHGIRFAADGAALELAVHRVAVREADANLLCLIVVTRVVSTCPDPTSGRSADPPRPADPVG